MGHLGNLSERGLSLMLARERESARRHSADWLRPRGYKVFATCKGCKRRAPVDLMAVRDARLGHLDLRWAKLRCTCGAVWAHIEVEPRLPPAFRWRPND